MAARRQGSGILCYNDTMNKMIPYFRSAQDRKVQGSGPDGVGGGLKLPEKALCLPLPGAMLEELRVQSRLMGVPQQWLMKTDLVERMEREMRRERSG